MGAPAGGRGAGAGFMAGGDMGMAGGGDTMGGDAGGIGVMGVMGGDGAAAGGMGSCVTSSRIVPPPCTEPDTVPSPRAMRSQVSL